MAPRKRMSQSADRSLENSNQDWTRSCNKRWVCRIGDCSQSFVRKFLLVNHRGQIHGLSIHERSIPNQRRQRRRNGYAVEGMEKPAKRQRLRLNWNAADKWSRKSEFLELNSQGILDKCLHATENNSIHGSFPEKLFQGLCIVVLRLLEHVHGIGSPLLLLTEGEGLLREEQVQKVKPLIKEVTKKEQDDIPSTSCNLSELNLPELEEELEELQVAKKKANEGQVEEEEKGRIQRAVKAEKRKANGRKKRTTRVGRWKRSE